MDSIFAAIIGAIVLIGLAIAGWAARRVREQRDKRGVRLRLRVECAENIKTLNEFWQQVDSSQFWVQGTGYSHEEIEFHKRRRLASVPLPAWSHLMWERQAEAARLDLSEEEFENALRLHTDLDMFSDMRAKLQEALATDTNSKLSRDFDDWMLQKARGRALNGRDALERSMFAALSAFNASTEPCWAECSVIHNRAGRTNPIQEDAPPKPLIDRIRRKLAVRIRIRIERPKEL